MEYDIRVSRDGSYIVVRVRGAISRKSAGEFARPAQEKSEAVGIHRLLFDVSQARNIESVSGNYFYAYEDMQDIWLDKRIRYAILVSADDHSHDFVETAVRNAGYNACLFRDEAAAIAWLTGP